MARRRYRKYYKRKSGRWAPNIEKVSANLICTSGEWSQPADLAVNPVQVTTGVSQTFTVKNIEISFTIESPDGFNPNLIEAVTAYIMYVPQGMSVTSSYYAEHPEYVMAYKYLGSPNGKVFNEIVPTGQEIQQYQPIKIRSRLSRKLQTGDKIILYIQGSNESQTNQNLTIAGIVRWWTKAN